MKKIKKVLNKKPHWVKWGIIAWFTGISVGVLFILCGRYTSQEGCFLIQALPPILSTASLIFANYIMHISGLSPNNQSINNITSILLYSIPYLIVGFIVGLIIDLRNKRR